MVLLFYTTMEVYTIFRTVSENISMVFDDGVVIEFETTPPNFREKGPPNEIGMVETCGSCKFNGNITSTRPCCTKYGVQYEGVGCLL